MAKFLLLKYYIMIKKQNEAPCAPDVLRNLYRTIATEKMSEMFATDLQRAQRYVIKINDLYFDYSKNRINDSVIKALISLANERELKTQIGRAHV